MTEQSFPFESFSDSDEPSVADLIATLSETAAWIDSQGDPAVAAGYLRHKLASFGYPVPQLLERPTVENPYDNVMILFNDTTQTAGLVADSPLLMEYLTSHSTRTASESVIASILSSNAPAISRWNAHECLNMDNWTIDYDDPEMDIEDRVHLLLNNKLSAVFQLAAYGELAENAAVEHAASVQHFTDNLDFATL